MRYVSLFTGIGGFDLALDRAGHIGLAMVEKDKACQNVLRKRFSNVLLHDDVMTFGRKDVHGTVDIVAGGSPCQAFSVAGLRKSLADERGNLTFEFIRIVNELQPKYVIWENVPGVLSTRDNAFGCFLAGLVGEDTPLLPAGGKWTNAGVVAGPQRSAAWRVLDAQYFGVAQRRRRVFVVASAASAKRSCIEILFEREGVRRDSPPSREARESVANTIGARIARSHTELDGHGAYIVGDFVTSGEKMFDEKGIHREKLSDEVTPTLNAFDTPLTFRVYDARGNGEGDTAPNLTDDHMKGISDYTPVVVSIDSQLNASEDKIGPLRSFAKGGTTGQIVVQQNAVGDPDVANGVDTKVRHDYDNQVGTAIVAFTARDYGADAQENVAPTVRSLSYTDHQAGSHGIAVATQATVRRLTPVECERLQAFPDGWTDIPQADTPRYKQLGNAVCVNVVEWIARRL